MKLTLRLALFASLATVLFSSPSEAISLRFKSKIFSSGPVIYACNAGVASAHPIRQVCYFNGRAENGACTPSSCDTAKENCNTNCICSTPPGTELINAIQMSTQDFVEADEPNTVAHELPRKDANGPKFETYFSEAQAWTQRISNLRTYFKTELYTGSYFVDICYRGSLIPGGFGYYAISTQASAIPFWVKDLKGFQAFDNNRDGLDFNTASVLGKEYTEKAGLSVQRFVVCDTTGDRAKAEFILDANTGLPVGGKGSFYTGTGSALLTPSAVTASHGGVTDPKFCKVRYVFSETNWSAPTPWLRVNRAEGAEVCTYTVINDPVANKVN